MIATKLDGIHKGLVEELSYHGMYSNIFTDGNYKISDESNLVRALVHAGKDEIVVMKDR